MTCLGEGLRCPSAIVSYRKLCFAPPKYDRRLKSRTFRSQWSSGSICLTAVHEVLGSNRAVGSCVYRTTTATYSLGHGLCAPFLQCHCLGQLSLLPYVGR